MSTTKRIMFAVTAAIIMGVVLLFNLDIVAGGVSFLGYPLKVCIQHFFTAPFIYYAMGALFPRTIVRGGAVPAVIVVAIGTMIYTLLANLPSWDWNGIMFRLGSVLAGGLLLWLFARNK